MIVAMKEKIKTTSQGHSFEDYISNGEISAGSALSFCTWGNVMDNITFLKPLRGNP